MEWKEQGRKSSQSFIGQIFMRSGVGPISPLDGSAGFVGRGSVWIPVHIKVNPYENSHLKLIVVAIY